MYSIIHQLRTAGPIWLKFFFVYFVSMRISRKVLFTLLPPPPVGDIIGILRFTMKIFVYKWLLLVFNNN